MSECMKCGSKDIVVAKIGRTNIQVLNEDCEWYKLGGLLFRPVPIVCLNCRHIELTVSEQDLEKAKKELKK